MSCDSADIELTSKEAALEFSIDLLLFHLQNTSGGLFGSTQNKPAFGTSSTGTNLFGTKPTGTFGGFGTQASASPFGTTSTNTGTGLFGNQNKPSGFSLGTSGTGFGKHKYFYCRTVSTDVAYL